MTPTQLIAALTDVIGPIDYVAAGRILLAAVLGGTIGWERERHGRAAGFRTHLLLCVGCALELVEYTVDREVVGEALYKMQLRYVRPVHFKRAANDLSQGLSAEGLSRIEWL